MTSTRKSEANRRNALKSSGPMTPEGKTTVHLNALRHDLLSTGVLLPGEDEQAGRELGECLRAELQPVGELESLLADRITSPFWRLRRLGRVEVGIFAWELDERVRNPDTSTLGLAFRRDANTANAFSKLSRYETTMEPGLYKALQAAGGAARGTPPPLAVDVDVSGTPEDDR